MNKNRPVIILSLLLPLLAVIFFLSGAGRDIENRTIDWRFRLRGPRPVSKNIFIAAMDDNSINMLGRWPWRRGYIASFLNRLMTAPPSGTVLDILYTEHSSDYPADDRLLARMASGLGNVYFPFYCLYGSPPGDREAGSGMPDENRELLERISLGKAEMYPGVDFISVGTVVMPVPAFSAAAYGSGYVNSEPDPDGVNRWIPLVMRYGEYILPNVSFAAALDYLGADRKSMRIRPGKHITFRTPEKTYRIPVDNQVRMMVNHAGPFHPDIIPMGSFVGLLSAYDNYAAGEDPGVDFKQIQDSIMYVGLTATGTSDLGVTPFAPLFPMVGYLANAASNIIEEDYMKVMPAWVNIMIILLLGYAAASVTARRRVAEAALLNTGLLLLCFAAAAGLFYRNIVITLSYPVFSVLLSYAGVTLYRFTSEEKEKKIIKTMFSRYVSSQIVDELLKSPESINLGGTRKNLTVFFSDIRGFTAMSEQLAPEDVVGVLNEYLTEMIDIIFKYNGTLDKFMGDAVMAVWGAPVPQAEHARLAVMAAWDMLLRLVELQKKWEKEGKKTISVGMGINTGDVVIGNMGSLQFSDYTVIGDNVNLAARLEENALAGQLLISESTYREVRDIVEVRRLEPMRVKGKEKPVEVYEVLSVKNG